MGSEVGAAITPPVEIGPDGRGIVVSRGAAYVLDGGGAGPLSLALVNTLATVYVMRPIWAVRLGVPIWLGYVSASGCVGGPRLTLDVGLAWLVTWLDETDALLDG